MEKIKNKAIIWLFALVLLGFSAAHLLLPDKEVSTAERRRLAKLPVPTAQTLLSGDFSKDMESYLLDQFPLRESLRSAKALMQTVVLRQLDSNGIYLQNGSAVKMEYPLDEAQVQAAADKLQAIEAELPADCNAYYAVIPDKNYYAAEKNGHLRLDYSRLEAILARTLTAQRIPLGDTLSAESYYNTDAHWRQESIYPVAERLAVQMGATEGFLPLESYTVQSFSPFYGVYYGQAALPLPPDTLRYLTSELTQRAVMTGLEFEGTRSVYEPEHLHHADSYDVFLSGAQALLKIELPQAQSDRKLVVFRDSFGSSIMPFLLGAYEEITLIDLRYIPAALVREYVTFDEQDVLFLLSSTVLNSGRLLK